MNLFLFLFLSITNGDYESDSMHDIGTGDDLQNAGMTVERRSLLLYLKPWTLGLVNSRARDNRTDPRNWSDYADGFLILVRPN